MRLPEFERHITDAAEALQKCASAIKDNDAFEVESWLIQASKDLSGCRDFASKWADEQEAEIAQAEESKGNDIISA